MDMTDRVKIRIWHPYRADVVGKGQRKPRRTTFRAPLDVEIPQVARADVRDAGRVVQGRAEWAKMGAGEERTVTYRGWNGALWTPVVRPNDRGQPVAVGFPAGTTDRTSRSPFFLDAALNEYEHRTGTRVDWFRIKTPDEVEGETVADDRAVAADIAKGLAERLLLVDNRIWQYQPEPLWAVQQMGLGCYCVYLDTPAAGRHPFRSSAETAFRADRLDDMLGWSAEIGRLRHRDPELFGPSGRVLEFDEAFLGRDDLVSETCRLGEVVLRTFADRIANMTVAGVDAYAEARSAYERLVTAGHRSDVAPFLAGVGDMAADLRRFDHPDAAAASRDEALKILDVLDLRIRRYEGASLEAVYAERAPALSAAPAV
jgi:hypothetical protein